MADRSPASVSPGPEHRRVAAQQYERARQVIDAGDHDYGRTLLLNCCVLDPANLIYRRTLRALQKRKYENNLRGSRAAFLTAFFTRFRLRLARRSGKHLRVLELGERVLMRNPWDTRTQVLMSDSADRLGMPEVAAFILEQARQKNPNDIRVNRPLARLLERLGHFEQAIAVWTLVSKADPTDEEAQEKVKQLPATQTITRGQYERAVETGDSAPFHEAMQAARAPAADAAPAKSAAETRLSRQVEPLRTKIAADPANPNHYLQLADIYHRAQQPDDARKVLEEGLGPTGQHFDLQMQLAELDIEPFRLNLHLTEERLKAQPQDEELRRIRLRLVKEINTRELDLFRRRADRYPADAAARLELGIRLLRAGQTEEAILELQQARRDLRHRGKALLYLGYAFKGKNNWPLAKRNFEEALQDLPPSEENSRKELLFQLAKGAAETQDWENAIRMGSELANLEYGYREIGRLLDEWQRQKSARAID